MLWLVGSGASFGLWLLPLGMLFWPDLPIPAAWCSPVEPRHLVMAMITWRLASWALSLARWLPGVHRVCATAL